MAALFGQSGDGRRESKSLAEFRAGKMRLSDRTVTADVRKGLIFMKMQEDGLLHFCWKDRQSGKVEDDFIVFPGDAEMKRVPQCTTGRVMLLKFRDSSRRFFYWMQEPREEKDVDFLKKINELIEHPPDPSTAGSGEGLGGAHGLGSSIMAGVQDSQLQSLLASASGGGRGMDQQQLMELLNSGLSPGMGGLLAPFEAMGRGSSSVRPPSSSPSSTSAPVPVLHSHSHSAQSQQQSSQQQPQSSQPQSSQPQSSQPQSSQPQSSQQQQSSQDGQLQLGALQNILSSMNIPAPQEQGEVEDISLSEVVTSDVLRPLANGPEAQSQLNPLLPPTHESAGAVLSSPQFQQALGLFGSALQSGQLGPLMTQFGFSESVAQAASTGGIRGFASALQRELGSDSEQATQEEEVAKDESEKKSSD